MLRDRGYSVPASEIDLSLQDFRFLHGPTPYIGRLRFSTTHCTDPSDRTYLGTAGRSSLQLTGDVEGESMLDTLLVICMQTLSRPECDCLTSVASTLPLTLSFLVAMGDISLRKTGVEEKRAKVQKESNVLLDYTRKAISRLTYLKRTLAQLEDDGSQSMLSIGRTIWF
ncbi:uncharacterized protein [Malus domestica]|uniref:uncharacterized protein n=1 Tax=Malus domestica TaxID=3750 RepID=UPI0010A9B505|nr:uncharacterized protein LOC103449749 isoform X1 [Malus domestica]XP_028946447.1 uncharacterized protein LOC103449749 isoform X1 [Malus domestica]